MSAADDDPGADGAIDRAQIDQLLGALPAEHRAVLFGKVDDALDRLMPVLRDPATGAGGVREAAHELKGMLASLGLTGASALAARIEREAEAGGARDDLTDRLDRAAHDGLAALRAEGN